MLLTPGDEQLEALADSGTAHVAVLPFTAELAAYSAEQPSSSTSSIGTLSCASSSSGYDHGLGRGRAGRLRRC